MSQRDRLSAGGEAERLYQSAGRLAALGRFEDAKADYLAALAQAPTHFGALNDLGALLYQAEFRTAARTCYAEAVKHHPDQPAGHINLANALLANGEAGAARGTMRPPWGSRRIIPTLCKAWPTCCRIKATLSPPTCIGVAAMARGG